MNTHKSGTECQLRDAHSQYVLTGTMAEHLDETATDPLARYKKLHQWILAREAGQVFPYAKRTVSRISPETECILQSGQRVRGVNFASQDYLNLSSNAKVKDAAKAAMDRYGVHSAGSSALMGNTAAGAELEETIASFTGYRDCTLFPTGWGAGYGIIRALTRPQDHVVIDILAHGCLHEGARAATQNVHVFPHISNEGVERRLSRIREKDARNSVIVVTESTFSMDSDVPDLRELQSICSRFNAKLIVDCAHDLGAIGPKGGGYLELQDFVGQVDVLMGSFSKTFASTGGFVACNDQALKHGIRYNCGPNLFSNTMSPVNAALVNECFRIVAGNEGKKLREKLLANVKLLRRLLVKSGFDVLGKESAIVPVIIGGPALSRLTTRFALEAGGLVNLVEYPTVSRNTCRWRLQVMAEHTEEQIRRFVDIACFARERAETELLKLENQGDAA